MNFIRKILFPFAFLYGLMTSIRNFLYDKRIFKSAEFNIPIIAVGNLSVGGTGKSPQIEYLIRLLSDKYKVATLSRGYKRKSEGFILANENSNAEILGDEPFQFHQKFPKIQVAVDADRKNGIEQLLSQAEKPNIILLDDAYQHRKVKAGFYILLSSYGELYADDYMLPTGDLRESRSGAKRANVIIVTKCPSDLSLKEQTQIQLQLKPNRNQNIYFSSIQYDDFVYSDTEKIAVDEVLKTDKIILAGIAKPKPFFKYLKNETDECLQFPDHHHFSENELTDIQKKARGKIIITTEKDYVRLKDSILKEQLYYLPIKSEFLSEKESFDERILEFCSR